MKLSCTVLLDSGPVERVCFFVVSRARFPVFLCGVSIFSPGSPGSARSPKTRKRSSVSSPDDAPADPRDPWVGYAKRFTQYTVKVRLQLENQTQILHSDSPLQGFYVELPRSKKCHRGKMNVFPLQRPLRAALSQVDCWSQTAMQGRGMMVHLKSHSCKHKTSITQGLVGGVAKTQKGKQAAATCWRVW